MIKAVIFDCFGVLATESWLPFKARHFGSDEELFQQATDLSKQANSGMIGSETFLEKISELAGVERAEAAKAMVGNVPNEPLFEYIRELKKHYKIGFLSNIASDRLKQIFTAEQLAVFDAIALSFETGYIKPQRQAFEAMARQLGVGPEECVLVDDQAVNAEGARAAAMPAVVYTDVESLRQQLGELLAYPKS